MNKLDWALFALLLPLAVWAEAKKPSPNVVLILPDDLGWQDIKRYDIDESNPVENSLSGADCKLTVARPVREGVMKLHEFMAGKANS